MPGSAEPQRKCLAPFKKSPLLVRKPNGRRVLMGRYALFYWGVRGTHHRGSLKGMKYCTLLLFAAVTFPGHGQSFRAEPVANPSGKGGVQANLSAAPDGSVVL